MEISIKAEVKSPVLLSARKVGLYAKPGEKVTRVLDIVGLLDKPLHLTPVEFNLASHVTYHIEEVVKGKKFRIHFATIPGQPSRFRGYLKLKTSYPEKSEITVRIAGRIEDGK